MLNSAWNSLLNIRPVCQNIDWTSELGCPIGTTIASYLKLNSSSLLPQPLVKLILLMFPISANGITVTLLVSLGVIPHFPVLLPPYPTGVGLYVVPIVTLKSPVLSIPTPLQHFSPCHYSLPSLSNALHPSCQRAAQIILLISGYDHITSLLKILRWLPTVFSMKSELLQLGHNFTHIILRCTMI